MHNPSLPKRDLKAIRGIPMTLEDKPFVAVPLPILKDLLKGAIPFASAAGVPVGSIDARAFARHTLANNLKKARHQAQMTQVDIAKAMRVSQARISQVESGVEPVSVTFVKRWLKACGLPEDWKG